MGRTEAMMYVGWVSGIEWLGKNALEISSLIVLVLRIMAHFGEGITFNRQKSFKNSKGEVCVWGGGEWVLHVILQAD